MIVSTSKRFIIIHVPKTGGTTLTYTFGPYSDTIAKYPFLGKVIDLNVPNRIRFNFEETPQKRKLVKECWDDLTDVLKQHPERVGYQAVAHHRFSQHSRIRDVFNKEILEKNADFYKFGFVRNPWSYCLSVFLDKFVAPRMWAVEDTQAKRKELITPENLNKFVTDQFTALEENELTMFFDRTQRSYFVDKSGEIAVDHIARFENLNDELDMLCKKLDIPKVEVKSDQQNKGNFEKMSYRDFFDDKTRDLVGEEFEEDIEEFGYSY